MKEYFEKKVDELGLNLEEANKDFKEYLEKYPDYKITKANITKFLKSMTVEPSNMEHQEESEEEEAEVPTTTYLGKDPITGKELYL